MTNNKNNKRKMAVAVLAGLALTGIIGASAASLNGINGSLGADAQDVISCDSDGVDVSYDTEFVAGGPNGMFDVTAVTVSNVNFACDTLDFEVVLLNDANTAIGAASGTVGLVDNLDDDFTAAVTPESPATTVDAELVTGIAITISGPITP